MAKKSRVFLRGMSSEQYGLKEFREAQLAAPRVRNDDFVADDAQVGHSGDSQDSRTWWRIGPGDEPFLTQNLQVHFVEIPAGKSNHGHGHQNEAVFYILQGKGYEKIAIVSHSLGATMANQYLIHANATPIKAWVFVGIINGLEEMFRIKVPVLDVFGSKDWEITQVGAYERKKQIQKVPGSEQIIVPDAQHFFEGREDDLVKVIVAFLDSRFGGKPIASTTSN